jgi:hypothetical protein
MYAPGDHCARYCSTAEFTAAVVLSRRLTAHRPPGASAVVEFLNLILILTAAYLVLKQPERERAAFRILVVSTVLMAFLFTLATRSGLLPGVNY